MKILLISFLVLLSSCGSIKNQTENFEFISFYGQFYLQDKNANINAQKYNFSDKDGEKRLVEYGDELVIFTQTYGNVKGSYKVLDSEPYISDFKKYDHVVEGSISIKNNELDIFAWGEKTPNKKIKLNDGNYRVRILCSNFNSVKERDLQYDTDNDFYEILIWRSHEKGIKVLKMYSNK